jgi:hypothetical protein
MPHLAQPGQLLLQLRGVPVAADAVGADALVDLAVMELGLGLATGPGDAALGVHDQVADEPGASERREGQQACRGVAARRPDDRPALRGGDDEILAMELRQPVHGVLQEVRPGMLESVPARVVGRGPKPEVRAQVDRRQPALPEPGDQVGGDAVGQGEEDRLRLVGHRIVDGKAGRREVGVGPADGLVIATPAHESHDADTGMAGEEADELRADVAGRSDDGDGDGVLPAASLDPRSRRRARAHGRTGPLAGGRRATGAGIGVTAVMTRMTIRRRCIVMQPGDFRGGGAAPPGRPALADPGPRAGSRAPQPRAERGSGRRSGPVTITSPSSVGPSGRTMR